MALHEGTRTDQAQLSVAEVLAPLSLVMDLGMGLPDEHAMRTCLLATALAREAGLPEREARDVYYATLLQHLGCTATAHEEAKHMGGDQLALRRVIHSTDEGRLSEMLGALGEIGRGDGPLQRVRAVVGLMQGARWGPPVQAAVCEVASHLARRLAMPEAVQHALGQMFERWDGKGHPRKLRGEAISAPARFAQVASRATALHAIGGSGAATAGVRVSSGGWLDPGIAALFERRGAELLREIDASDALSACVEAEPEPRLTVPRQDLDEMARAFADMVDLLSPSMLGHSSGVAEIAQSAGEGLRLSMAECVMLRRAALLHDLGRVAVPAGVWEKRGTLTGADWERVRLHSYYTERVLARVPLLAAEAAIAGQHHERMDRSGYHRGSGGREQPLAARILAAADVYQALQQARPHRPAFTASEAADQLAEDARAGRLDARVVEVILEAAGDRRSVAAPAPAGLTEREVEVLQLLAAGRSNGEIAERLVISRRTAEHHVQHVYAKLGMSTRPGAALFALEHGLL